MVDQAIPSIPPMGNYNKVDLQNICTNTSGRLTKVENYQGSTEQGSDSEIWGLCALMPLAFDNILNQEYRLTSIRIAVIPTENIKCW